MKIHVNFEHDLSEFHYKVRIAKRVLLKHHLKRKWRKLLGR